MTKQRKIKLSAWELCAIEEALNNGLPHIDKDGLERLKQKLRDCDEVVLVIIDTP